MENIENYKEIIEKKNQEYIKKCSKFCVVIDAVTIICLIILSVSLLFFGFSGKVYTFVMYVAFWIVTVPPMMAEEYFYKKRNRELEKICYSNSGEKRELDENSEEEYLEKYDEVFYKETMPGLFITGGIAIVSLLIWGVMQRGA